MGFPGDIVTALTKANLFLSGGQGTTKRVPIALGSTSRIANKIPDIKLAVNPQSVSFNQGKRIVKRDHQGGSTWFHFSDENGRNNDILVMRFGGTTGNIDTRARTIAGGNTAGGTKKLQKWADLYQLTRDPIYDTKTNKENVFYIHYASPLFTKQFTFFGFFNEVLSFSENADSPFLKNWDFSFTVTRTFPDLNSMSDAIASTLQGLDILGKLGQSIDTLTGKATSIFTD